VAFEGLTTHSTKENFRMAEEIRVGDEVQLLSGGLVMTVGRIWVERGQTMARCDWVENGKQKEGSVAVTSLKPAIE
jgi:uncharacterized protein YodC (DUF2158 family)